MRVMKWIQYTVLIFAAALTVRAQTGSATNAVAVLSIDALVAEALRNNPELKFYEAEIIAAKAGRRTAGLLPNPELTGSIGQKAVSAGGIRDEGVAWSVGLMQPFEWPGRMGLRKAIANRDIELAELGYDRFKAALANRVRMLAHAVFGAQEKAAVAAEVSGRLRELRQVLVQRDPAGITPLLEARVIEASELTMQRRASETLLSSQAALFELNQLRGVPPETSITVEAPSLRFGTPPPKEALVEMALTNNFEIRMRVTELTQQGFRVALAKNERFAPISVGPMYSEERGGDRERVLAVGVSIPIPLWNRNSGNIETAKARRIQAETSYFVAQREIERKVLEASLTYRTKVAEIEKWRPDAVSHFKEAAELADRHYRLGAVPVATYIELQNQYLEAVDGILSTQSEALTAAGELELLTGVPIPISESSKGNPEPK